MSSEVGFCQGFMRADHSIHSIRDASILLLPVRVFSKSRADNDNRVFTALKVGAAIVSTPLILVALLVMHVVVAIIELIAACCSKQAPFAEFRFSCGACVRLVVQLTIIGEIVLLALAPLIEAHKKIEQTRI